MTTGPDTTNAPTDVGRCTSEPRPCYKVPLSRMYSQRHKCNICSGWVHISPPLSPAPPIEQISEDSTFTVLQLNANGVENKLTELGVLLERNKVKVAVIQESKLLAKFKNPCIRNYTTVRTDRTVPMVTEEDC